jgi:hypothetical protein
LKYNQDIQSCPAALVRNTCAGGERGGYRIFESLPRELALFREFFMRTKSRQFS